MDMLNEMAELVVFEELLMLSKMSLNPSTG